MQFFVYFTGRDSQSMPTAEGMAEMTNIMKKAFKSGMVVATGQIASQTAHIQLKAGEVKVTDGAFTDGGEFIPGFTVIRVETKQEALDWATELRRCMGDGVIRVTELSSTEL